MGLSTLKSGGLAIDSTILNGALESDFDGVAKLFADADHGIAVRMSQLADNFLASTGVIQGRTNSLDSQIRDIDSRRTAFQKRLEIIQDRYRKQFTSLDTLVASLQTTSTFLTQQISLFSRTNAS